MSPRLTVRLIVWTALVGALLPLPLHLSAGPGPIPTLVLGEWVEGTVDNAAGATWALMGEAGDRVTISGKSHVDMLLDLYDSRQTLLVTDFDSGSDFDPAIRDFRLPETGAYTVVIRGENGDSGTYRLSLDLETPESRELLAYGEEFAGDISTTTGIEFTFDASVGDVIAVYVGSDTNTELELYNSAGQEIASDDDSGPDDNPALHNVYLEAADRYTFVLRRVEGDDEADFRLHLDLVTSDPGALTPKPIAYGDKIDSALIHNLGERWSFEGAAGQFISLSLTSREFDPLLELYHGDDLVLRDDDSGPDRNAYVGHYRLSSSGAYTLLIQSHDNEIGAYHLELARMDTPNATKTAAFDVTTPGAVWNATGERWVFSGEIGERVTIAVSYAEFDSFIEVYDEDGTLIASDDDSGMDNLAALRGLALPDSGDYYIVVRGYWPREAGFYELLIELAD